MNNEETKINLLFERLIALAKYVDIHKLTNIDEVNEKLKEARKRQDDLLNSDEPSKCYNMICFANAILRLEWSIVCQKANKDKIYAKNN